MLRDVAKGWSVHVIDVWAAFGEDRSLLLDDGLHLSIEGHRLYGATVQRALDRYLQP
jgi:lysophospholipase L1-like esterase